MIVPPARTAPAGRAAAPSRGTAAPAPADAEAQLVGELLAHPPPTAGDIALNAEEAAFDLSLKVQAEREREMNALRDLAMEQMKRDDETLKKWIALI